MKFRSPLAPSPQLLAPKLLPYLLLLAGGVSGVLLSCSSNLAPGSQLNRFRLLAVRATPPAVMGGTSAHLDTLLYDPLMGDAPTFIWLACAPPPNSPNTFCLDQIAAPDGGTGGSNNQNADGGGLIPGMAGLTFCAGQSLNTPCLAGIGPAIDFTPPLIPPDSTGYPGSVLFTLIVASQNTGLKGCAQSISQNQGIPDGCEVAFKQLYTFDHDPQATNPSVGSLQIDNMPLASAQPVAPGSKHMLQASFTAGTPVPLPSAGPPSPYAAWLATAGTLDMWHTNVTNFNDTWTAPNGMDAQAGAQLFLVVRDGTGGVGWVTGNLPVQ